MDLFKYIRPGLMALSLCCAAGAQADEPVPPPTTETAAATTAGEATGCAGAENKTSESTEGQGTSCAEKPDATKITAAKAEILMIIDKSGSMYALTDDTIGGFNSMIKKFQDQKINGRVTTVFFNDKVITIHDRQDLSTVKPISRKEYTAEGTTSLLDAMGISVSKLAACPDIKEAKDTQVVAVVITDGMENSSKEYKKAMVKQMVEDRQKDGWRFIFLGANIDAASEAESLGIGRSNAVKYRNTSSGVRSNYEAVVDFTGAAMEAAESAVPMSEDWKKKVEKDE